MRPKPQALKYIHGYSETEQARLLDQARLLEPLVLRRVEWPDRARVLDLGCGVGAQSRALLKKWPLITVTGVDASSEQLAAAERLLRVETRTRRFVPVQADASALPFKDETFDAVFVCFVLEHLSRPAAALKEAVRVLKNGGRLYCTEVFNSGVYLYPRNPVVEKYWSAFNAHQRDLGGDPDIGVKLPGLLSDAGLSEVKSFESVGPLMDRRMKSPAARRKFMRIWHDLFQGPADALRRSGTVSSGDVEVTRQHLLSLAKNPEGIFFYAAFQACAVK